MSHAAQRGKAGVVAALLAHRRANVSAASMSVEALVRLRDRHGATPLHHACCYSTAAPRLGDTVTALTTAAPSSVHDTVTPPPPGDDADGDANAVALSTAATTLLLPGRTPWAVLLAAPQDADDERAAIWLDVRAAAGAPKCHTNGGKAAAYAALALAGAGFAPADPRNSGAAPQDVAAAVDEELAVVRRAEVAAGLPATVAAEGDHRADEAAPWRWAVDVLPSLLRASGVDERRRLHGLAKEAHDRRVADDKAAKATAALDAVQRAKVRAGLNGMLYWGALAAILLWYWGDQFVPPSWR